MGARLTEVAASYSRMPAYPMDRTDLLGVLNSLVDLHRQMSVQSELNGLVYWLREAASFCICSAAGLSRNGVADVVATALKRGKSWAMLAGIDQRGNPTKVMAAGLRSVFEMQASNVAHAAIRAYRWEGDYCEQAARSLVALAGVLLPASVYFEAIRDGVRPTFRGTGEQLALF